ncbi:MAG: MFS transporter [Gammaproteobacteria bacterium]|nr:MFS transporter [Gammaproteobacteria bacterium]MDH5653386.1 MFS transporter [Gammaproteobacteria bacterium]
MVEQVKQHKSSPLIDLLISIVIPSVILMKLSGDDDLGATGALIVALCFPVGWGLLELIRHKKYNFIAILGIVSVLLTGGIGLLKLDPQWLAVKEAAMPAIMGIAVLISTHTRYPLIRTMVYNPAIVRVEMIHDRLTETGNTEPFEQRLRNANYLFGATFFFSSLMNYVLAKWIVVSPAGSTAFNEELGRLTLLSYPMIAIPSTFMIFAILYYLWRTLRDLTGLTLESVMIVKE